MFCLFNQGENEKCKKCPQNRVKIGPILHFVGNMVFFY